MTGRGERTLAGEDPPWTVSDASLGEAAGDAAEGADPLTDYSVRFYHALADDETHLSVADELVRMDAPATIQSEIGSEVAVAESTLSEHGVLPTVGLFGPVAAVPKLQRVDEAVWRRRVWNCDWLRDNWRDLTRPVGVPDPPPQFERLPVLYALYGDDRSEPVDLRVLPFIDAVARFAGFTESVAVDVDAFGPVPEGHADVGGQDPDRFHCYDVAVTITADAFDYGFRAFGADGPSPDRARARLESFLELVVLESIAFALYHRVVRSTPEGVEFDPSVTIAELARLIPGGLDLDRTGGGDVDRTPSGVALPEEAPDPAEKLRWGQERLLLDATASGDRIEITGELRIKHKTVDSIARTNAEQNR